MSITGHLGDSKLFKRESSNLLLNRKWTEVLKSRTSNPVSPEPPGPRSQAPRRLWGREWGSTPIGSSRVFSMEPPVSPTEKSSFISRSIADLGQFCAKVMTYINAITNTQNATVQLRRRNTKNHWKNRHDNFLVIYASIAKTHFKCPNIVLNWAIIFGIQLMRRNVLVFLLKERK